MIKQVALSANGSYQENFLKVAILNCSMKEAMTDTLRRALFP